MKNLTVFYSEKGMTRSVAEKIAARIGTELFEIAEENPKRSLFGRKPKTLKPLPEAEEGLGHAVICLPIKSSGHLPSLAREFLAMQKGKLPHVSYVFVKRGAVKDMPQRIVELDELLGVTFERAAFIDPADARLEESIAAFADGLNL